MDVFVNERTPSGGPSPHTKPITAHAVLLLLSSRHHIACSLAPLPHEVGSTSWEDGVQSVLFMLYLQDPARPLAQSAHSEASG